MKEICGFLSKSGSFHKTEKECEIADAEYDIKIVKEKLNKFQDELENYILGHGGREDLYSEYHRNKDFIFEAVTTQVLINFDNFKDVVEKGKKLRKQLDTMKKENEKYYIKKWWLNTKWW